MKKLIAATSITLATMIAPMSAQAEFVDGNKLLSWLDSSDETDIAIGMGYVTGVFDALSGVMVCAPTNVTIRQVVDMTKRALRAVPEARNKSADQFVSTITSAQWPCKKKTSGNTNV